MSLCLSCLPFAQQNAFLSEVQLTLTQSRADIEVYSASSTHFAASLGICEASALRGRKNLGSPRKVKLSLLGLGQEQPGALWLGWCQEMPFRNFGSSCVVSRETRAPLTPMWQRGD